MLTISGVPSGEGTDLLRRHAPDLTWQDRSPFLGASAAPAIPWLRLARRDHRAEADVRLPVRRPAPRGVAVSFAPEDGLGAHAWAAAAGLHLLAADSAAVATAADKITSLALFERAGVATPRTWVVRDDIPAGATGSLVVQRRANNLTGKGTRHVTTPDQLAEALRAWSGETLRVSAHVDGVPVTVSGCVTRQGTVVSALSHQLVGIAELTPYWGAHCGNQLVADDDLPAGAAARCREVCAAVGNQLAQLGFLGAFGLDLLVTPDAAVVAIEINPRFQTVVSLVQAQERAAGLLPSLGTHVLASLLPSVPVEEVRARCLRLSQLVVTAGRAGVLRSVITSGVHRLVRGRLQRHGEGDLATLRPGEALLWAHAHPGDRIRPGEELALLQFPGPVAPVSARPELCAQAQEWIRAVRHALVVEDA
ncbi:ATP-grasp domain-containing protein [Lentzea sp. NEAU-D7]|uniref:ATP-grasp domain-containing protein n=1 Tax=Lentzea sp. NEAU-D7 TaxID=2994667 RepID=UPI00224B1B67|nr:ATP-grasp domain-containing protein [Lentzea sp. NEAU-D7]MCX2946744.1 ATP-grasp domain-containing protein [Lentzea sp. NEAU-D7]